MKSKKLQLLSLFPLALLLTGVIIHIIPYFYNRSLWIDELLLSGSIKTRDFGNLVSSPLEHGQSAPIGYLYIVKLFTTIFGINEFSLRIWSLISFFGCLICFYLILKQILDAKYPLLFTAFFSVIPFYIYYSNEFKPYMSDCMFILLVVLLYGMFSKGKLSFTVMSLSFAVILWFSFSSVFFIAAAMIIIVIQNVFSMIKSKAIPEHEIKFLLLCFIVLFSFLLYYFIWLGKTNENAGDKAYWSFLQFPLIPTSINDLKTIYKMFLQTMAPFLSVNKTLLFIIPLLDIYSFIVLAKNKKLQFAFNIVIGIILLLVASYLGFYPIQDRLVQFVPLLMLLLAAVAIEDILKRCENFLFNNKNKVIRVSYCVAVLLVCAVSFVLPLKRAVTGILPGGEYTCRKSSETAKNVKYLVDNASDTDMVYVYADSTLAFIHYSDGYNKTILKNYIQGEKFSIGKKDKAYSYDYDVDFDAIRKEISKMNNYDSVYLFFSNMNPEKDRMGVAFMEELRKYGNVKVANCSDDTYLYHFQRNN